mmetsp:Transcript_31504/g.76053  ORF Transcript_31504/g.76053 Transcript_31504/m.76053 type:complete len:226 (-) Transcript_31504:463-1140(-)
MSSSHAFCCDEMSFSSPFKLSIVVSRATSASLLVRSWSSNCVSCVSSSDDCRCHSEITTFASLSCSCSCVSKSAIVDSSSPTRSSHCLTTSSSLLSASCAAAKLSSLCFSCSANSLTFSGGMDSICQRIVAFSCSRVCFDTSNASLLRLDSSNSFVFSSSARRTEVPSSWSFCNLRLRSSQLTFDADNSFSRLDKVSVDNSCCSFLALFSATISSSKFVIFSSNS